MMANSEHYNCRCVLIDIVDFDEIGFDLDVTPVEWAWKLDIFDLIEAILIVNEAFKE